jgi:hypothetical protein
MDKPDSSQALSTEGKELEEHFQPWAVTPRCKNILRHILPCLVSKETDGNGGMTLVFSSQWDEDVTIEFGPPAPEKVISGAPVSVLDAAKLHGSVSFDNCGGGSFCWEPQGVEFEFGYDEYDDDPGEGFDSLENRYPCLAYAGQNFFIQDRADKNAAGEPLIVLFDHGGSFEDMPVFDGGNQKKEPYGIGGFLLRAIGAYILDTEDLADCGMG